MPYRSVGHADCTAPTRKHELDHTDHTDHTIIQIIQIIQIKESICPAWQIESMKLESILCATCAHPLHLGHRRPYCNAGRYPLPTHPTGRRSCAVIIVHSILVQSTEISGRSGSTPSELQYYTINNSTCTFGGTNNFELVWDKFTVQHEKTPHPLGQVSRLIFSTAGRESSVLQYH